MEASNKVTSENQLINLREGIKSRYQTYHNRDSVRFPLLELNTNRANYEPLRESFEEEFFVVRGIDRQQKTIHIPSTTTLASIFTNDLYVPNPKIWNTCRSYVEGQAKMIGGHIEPAQYARQPLPNMNVKWSLWVGIGILSGLLIGLSVSRYWAARASSRFELTAQYTTVPRPLRIDKPISKSRVFPSFVVTGQAGPGEVVWLVAHLQNTDNYWVQFPALADHRGLWMTAITVDGGGFDNTGQTHRIRAFTNPVNELRVSDILRTWPKAERSTEIVYVIMDSTAKPLN